MAKSVDATDIEISTGKKKHVRLLERYVAQHALEAVPLLDKARAEGSKVMRDAAWLLTARLDVAYAEHDALQRSNGVEDAKKKERAPMLEGLERVATAACLQRLVEVGEPFNPAHAGPAALLRALPTLLTSATDCAWLRCFDGESDESDHAVPLVREKLDALSPEGRAAAVTWLLNNGDLETARRRDLTLAEQLEAFELLPADEAFDRFAPLWRDDPKQLRGAAHLIERKVDPRWVDVFAAHAKTDPELYALGLCHLPCPRAVEPMLTLTTGLPWGRQLKELLYGLSKTGDPRAVAALERWVPTDEGKVDALFLTTAINRCRSHGRAG